MNLYFARCLVMLVLSFHFLFFLPVRSKQPEFEPKAFIDDDFFYKFVSDKAIELIYKHGFNAGSGYSETWIRDFNTFIECSLNCSLPWETIRRNLTVFFGFQNETDFNTIDGFVTKKPDFESNASSPNEGRVKQEWRRSKYFPEFWGFKNTVEIDQETSLVQAVYKYISITSDYSILDVKFGDYSIKERIELALKYLLDNKFSEKYGLLQTATRADWGDIQPEDDPGSWISNLTHWSVSVYDNAMFVIAVNNFIELFPEKAQFWNEVKQNITKNIREFLWDEKTKKFIPHRYINGSPFPHSFDEDSLYFFGATGISIQAGLLTPDEIESNVKQMRENVRKAGAFSVGLTIYPAYPKGYFKNPRMFPYGYQNGGDWSWFGGRIVQGLIENQMFDVAKEFLQPMVERVWMFGDFYEWYSPQCDPMGSKMFKGSAGVLWKAIRMLEESKN